MPRLGKPSDDNDVEMFKEGGIGRKLCPKCEKYFKGPTRKNCPKCGTAIPKKTTGNAKRPATDGFSIVRSALTFAKSRGGLEAAKADLIELEGFLGACGGIKEAKEALERLTELEQLQKGK